MRVSSVCAKYLSLFFKSHLSSSCFCFFFFNDPAPPEIYTLSLHDALPIWEARISGDGERRAEPHAALEGAVRAVRCRTAAIGIGRSERASEHGDRRVIMHAAMKCNGDRKSTRLNSSHGYISYAVFCLKKKK